MYKFSAHSLNQYATLDPRLQLICDHLIKVHDFRIQEGYRDRATQEKYFQEGVTKVHFPDSAHNKSPSRAMDLYPFVNNRGIGYGGEMSLNDKLKMVYFQGIVRGIAARLGIPIVQGINWDNDQEIITDQNFQDWPHVELV